MAAYHILTRRMSFNVDITWDTSHGANNDLWMMLDQVGKKGAMLQFLVSYNVPHGPWSEDARYHQSVAALSDMFETSTPAQSPLFMSMWVQILHDFREAGLLSDSASADDVWEAMRTHSPWRRKGSKLVKSRFMAFVRESRMEIAQLSARALGYLYVCLELGWLKGSLPVTLFDSGAKTSSDPAEKSTKATVESSAEKVLRRMGANSTVLAAITFADRGTGRLLKMVHEVAAPLEAWHSSRPLVGANMYAGDQ